MLRDSKELLDSIRKSFRNNIGHSSWQKKIATIAKEKYNVPEKVSSDYITLRIDIAEATNFLLYIFTDLIFPSELIDGWFSQQEIKEFSKAKWHVETIDFPLRFNMVKINEEQFVGSISVKELMLLKDSQIINYNENAQRTMEHVIKGDVEYYQISLNKEAVAAIMDSYEKDLYIPNTITFNLPDDTVYSYDDKKKELVIKQLDHLDILDGYHRYIAMSKICSINPDFDYDMELRIVQFSEDKARRFIWQEDQKTKMKKVDSESFNSAKTSNKIVSRLNNDSTFIFSGKISRNNGQINAADFANVIDVVFLSDLKKESETRAVISITNALRHSFDSVLQVAPEMDEQKWNKKHILTLAYLLKYGNLDDFKKQYERIANASNIYANAILTKADITRIHKLNMFCDGKEGVKHG